MAPTCGLTRAGLTLTDRALLDGDLGRAWTYNPAIFLVALVALALAARAVARAVSGRWLSMNLRLSRSACFGLMTVVLALWTNQPAHFDLLVR